MSKKLKKSKERSLLLKMDDFAFLSNNEKERLVYNLIIENIK